MIHRFLPPVLLTSLLLVSCAESIQPVALPTPEVITVAVEPAAWPLVPAIQVCSDTIPDLVAAPQEVSPAYSDWADFDFFLRLGEPEELPPFAAAVGIEQVVVVLNPANPLISLSVEELQGIFSGHIRQWSDIRGPSKPIQVWVFPEGEAMNGVFEQAIMEGGTIASHAMVAPNPAAMLEAVSEDPNAIGYIPRAWLEDRVRPLEMDPETAEILRLPVLALSAVEPAGAAGQLLHCLQQGEGQADIFRLYEE